MSRVFLTLVKVTFDYSLKEIESFIEGEVEIGENPVMPHGRKKSKVEGMNKESQPTGEGKIVFDLKFKLLLPEDKPDEYRHVIVNLEAQNRISPGYDLAKRGIYYCSRLISEQLTSISDQNVYNGLKKQIP